MTSPAVFYRVGGREYPLRTTGRCAICLHPSRGDIEYAILLGHTYASIGREFDLESHLLSYHVSRNHLPKDVAIQRAVMEERAQAVGESVEDGARSLVDHLSMARMVMQRTYERVASGEVEPTLSEGLQAAKILQGAEEKVEGDVNVETMKQVILAYMRAASEVCSADQMRMIAEKVSANPIIKAIEAESATG